MTKRSIEYLQKAAGSITKYEAYLIEGDAVTDEIVLRKILETDSDGNVIMSPTQ